MTEIEMIYLYRSEHCEQIRDLIYERNKEMMNALTHNLFNARIKNLANEREDFLSTSYLAFLRCLKQYNIKQTEYSFTQALAVANKSFFMKECKQTTSLYNRATTYGVYSNKQFESYANDIANSIVSNDDDKIDQELLMGKINDFLKHYNIKIRRNIQMRALGYTNKEISKELHISA
jgi:hypothetical protein